MSLTRKATGPSPEQVEMARICNLNHVRPMDAEEQEVFNVEHLLAEAFDQGRRLYQPQSAAMRAFKEVRGGFFPIGVGWGKTLISIFCADHAFRCGVKKSILLVPANVVPQLWNVDIRWARKMVPLAVPFHLLAGRPAAARKAFADSNYPGCYVLPYSLLSQPDCLYLWEQIHPGLVIADEAHRLRNPRAARTKRVMDFVEQAEPWFVPLSGTMTNKGLFDYQHLIRPALRDQSPLPRLHGMVFLWDGVVNSKAGHSADGDGVHSMKPLVRWAQEQAPDQKFPLEETETYRRAFRMRLLSAPGVVATGDNEIGVSLQVVNEEVEPSQGHEQVVELIRQVREDFLTPNGDEIEHAFHCHKWEQELTAGFYYKLAWPDAPTLAARRAISVGEAAEILERAKLWHAATQKMHRLMREFFKTSPPGLDTPLELGRSMAQHAGKHVPPELYDAWCDQKALDFLGRPERDRSVVRVCDYKIQHAVRWVQRMASEGARGGLLWFYHQEMGDWLAEELAKAGREPLLCKAGANQEILSVGDPKSGGKGDRWTAASLTSHGEGKNLQAFQHQLYVQWPRDAKVIEQSLGRTHRNGQEADELVVHTCRTNEADDVNFAAGLNDAIYTCQTAGVKQKIIFCGHDPLPKIFSPEFLRERGTNAKMLSKEQRQMLKERFSYDKE